MGKRVSIVFEENDAVSDGVSFDCYLDGMTPQRMAEVNAMTPEKQFQELSAAEFWALRCFQITKHVMVQSGAFREAKKR
jgi:hypothetical protein